MIYLNISVFLPKDDEDLPIEEIKEKKSWRRSAIIIEIILCTGEAGFLTSFKLLSNCSTWISIDIIGILVTLGSLLVWHIRLITRGETSIETLSNKDDRAKLKLIGKVNKWLKCILNSVEAASFWTWNEIGLSHLLSSIPGVRQPFRLGNVRKLALVSRFSWRKVGNFEPETDTITVFCSNHYLIDRTWWHVIFPSSHPPSGDGIQWNFRNSKIWSTFCCYYYW